jgi:hypothetical protein
MHFRCGSGSMTPAIRIGDRVSISPGPACRVGDIVLYKAADGLLLHRVMAKSSRRILTKGDAVSWFDSPVYPKDILGRAICCERQGKQLSLGTLRSRLGGMALGIGVLLCPPMLPFLAVVRRFFREKMGLSFS